MNDVRIKNKLMFTYIVVVCVPVFIVGVLLTGAFRQNVLDQATEQTMNNVDKIKKQTADILRMPIEISDKLLVDARLTNVVNTQYETTFEATKALWDYRDFKDYMRLYNEIYNIRFYTTNMTMLDNWEFLKVNEEVSDTAWYKEAYMSEGIHWLYVDDATKNNKHYLSLIRKISFPEYRTSGILVIGVNQAKLNAMLSQEPFDTMIFDENGFVVAASDPSSVGVNISQMDFANQLINMQTGTYEFDYKGHRSKIIMEELRPNSSRNGLKIASVFTIDSIVSEANRISMLGLSIMAGSLIIAFSLIYIFSGILAKRMLVLNKDLNKVAMGDFNVISMIEGNDEIGLLSKRFNHMVNSIRDLMEEVSESHRQQGQLELRQKEIKLKMMASQINPHFLFNALESIRMKSHVNGQTEVASIVKMLGKMIRRNLEIGARQIPLKEELDNVRYYLEIQQFRYGDDRLTFEMELESDAELIDVPPLIIQPLVENAVVHGLENISEGGCVKVKTICQGEYLLIEVSDNGAGIGPNKLVEIQKSLLDMDEAEEYRIGLRNVHQRLVLLYGESCGLNLISNGEGLGTTILFRIPTGGQRHA
ncbi:MAG: sensor histidine kinase [Candidatus Pristimantibacillus sp.]